jgi:hypothetical protein
MRAGYRRLSDLGDLAHRAGELRPGTIIVDVEPLVAYWGTGQDDLDRGIARVTARLGAVPGLRVLCFATNSERAPSALPSPAAVRVIYLASARKPVTLVPYQGLPRPGVVIGDQVATDGLLARRLGYGFLLYSPGLAGVPLGPRLLGYGGRLLLPALFRPA